MTAEEKWNDLHVGDIIRVAWDDRQIRIGGKDDWRDQGEFSGTGLQIILEVWDERAGRWLDWGRFNTVGEIDQIYRWRAK